MGKETSLATEPGESKAPLSDSTLQRADSNASSLESFSKSKCDTNQANMHVSTEHLIRKHIMSYKPVYDPLDKFFCITKRGLSVSDMVYDFHEKNKTLQISFAYFRQVMESIGVIIRNFDNGASKKKVQKRKNSRVKKDELKFKCREYNIKSDAMLHSNRVGSLGVREKQCNTKSREEGISASANIATNVEGLDKSLEDMEQKQNESAEGKRKRLFEEVKKEIENITEVLN